MHVVSFVVVPALAAGVTVGALLAIARPAVGAAPNLFQDFTYTIGGAFVGEIIGGGGALLLGRIAAGNDRSVGLAVNMMTVIGGGAGIAIGTTAGVVMSIALSYFGR